MYVRFEKLQKKSALWDLYIVWNNKITAYKNSFVNRIRCYLISCGTPFVRMSKKRMYTIKIFLTTYKQYSFPLKLDFHLSIHNRLNEREIRSRWTGRISLFANTGLFDLRCKCKLEIIIVFFGWITFFFLRPPEFRPRIKRGFLIWRCLRGYWSKQKFYSGLNVPRVYGVTCPWGLSCSSSCSLNSTCQETPLWKLKDNQHDTIHTTDWYYSSTRSLFKIFSDSIFSSVCLHKKHFFSTDDFLRYSHAATSANTLYN